MPLPAYADCSALEPTLNNQSLRLTELKQRRANLDKLLQGQIDANFILGDAVGVTLDVDSDVMAAKKALQAKLQANQAQRVGNDPVPPVTFRDCPQQRDLWLGQEKQLRSLEEVVDQLRLSILNLPKNTRLAVVRETTQWQKLHRAQSALEAFAAKYPQDQPIAHFSAEVIAWIDYWRSSTQIWLGQLLTNPAGSGSLNEVWNETLRVPPPNSAIDWNIRTDIPLEELDSLYLLDQLEQAHSALIRESGQWRNQHIWAMGWVEFFKAMSNPKHFWQQLKTEIRSAPTNVIDAISRPFIRDYRRAVKQGKRGELLSNWFLQGLALLAIMSVLLKLAALTPHLLSQFQQKLLSTLQQRTLIQFNAAVLWFIKPNAPWFIVFSAANGIAALISEQWLILAWLAPIGTLYAAFRAVRVIVEWLISRTFTRSGQFVSSHTANQQSQDAQKVSWIMVLCFLSWVLIKGTGGGYLQFFVILFNAGLVWWILFWLMLRYKETVARFFLFVVGKGKSKKLDSMAAQKWWMMLIWPALFVLAHIVDVIAHLHQKLMIFDWYRSASVKLMRIRLAAEAKDEESAEEDSAPPDENYTDWMLRNNSTWVEAIDMNDVMPSIQKWCKEKSDDNVLLIVGEQGSGKTALINRLSSSWEETPLSVLNIPAKTTDPNAILPLIGAHLCIPDLKTVAELVTFDESLEPQIIVLDNTHNLFLSEVGHLNAYRVLNQCLNAHLKNIYWVVVMHSPSWTYLSCVFNRELRFSNIFKMPRWSPSDIRKLILSRHQGSRRRIRYDELLLSASAGSESSSVRAADSRVFNILWEQSGGVPQVAIQLWLAAARSKDNVVEIGVPSKPSSSPLKEMKDDLCFVYAAIVTHKSLTSDEIMLVTHFPEAIVRHALKQGLNIGLLRQDEAKRYRVNPAWQGTLSSFLTSKNMLWSN